MRAWIAIILVASVSLLGCREGNAMDPEAMLRLASALTKLSAAVESTCRYKNPPEGLRDAGLVSFATRHDPSLSVPFRDYVVRGKCEERHGIVLVCTKDDGRALLEDTGCSARLDAHLWQAEPPRACEFTVKVEQACAP